MEHLEYSKIYPVSCFFGEKFIYLGFGRNAHGGLMIPATRKNFEEGSEFDPHILKFRGWERDEKGVLKLYGLENIRIRDLPRKNLLLKLVEKFGSFTNPNFPFPEN